MACQVEEEKRKSYVNRIVVQAIKSLCPPGTSVTQDTSLGPTGLGHGGARRQQYHQAIQKLLAAQGCAMKTLTPDSFTDAALTRVRDVSKQVLEDLV